MFFSRDSRGSMDGMGPYCASLLPNGSMSKLVETCRNLSKLVKKIIEKTNNVPLQTVY